MKTQALVKLLQSKPQDEEVEFIVVTKEGKIVCMDIEAHAKDVQKVMAMFGDKK